MRPRLAEGRLEVLQIYRLLQSLHGNDSVHVKSMVENGVPNLINLMEPRDGLSGLHVAVTTEREELVSLLLSLGARPDVQDKQGRTPAMMAAELGNEEILTLLAEHEADFRLQDAEGKGLLFYCISPKWQSACLKVALNHQPDTNNVSRQGAHIFQLMCEKAQEHGVTCLLVLAEGADPNAADQKTGVTALMTAVREGCLQLVRAILKKGGNPNARDRKGRTPLHYAAMEGFFEVIQVLSAFSADFGVVDMEFCTPLHYAAATGDADCCRFLAQRGCNPKLRNRDGLTPRQVAKDCSNKAAAKELRKAEMQRGKAEKRSGVKLLSHPWALTLHDWSNEFQAELQQAFGDKSEMVPSERFSSVLRELNAPVDQDQIRVVISASDTFRQGLVSVTDFIKGVKYIQKPFLLSCHNPKQKKDWKGGKAASKKSKFVPPIPICTLPAEVMPRRPDGGPPTFMIEKFYNQSDTSRFSHDRPPKHPVENDSAWYQESPQKLYVNINECVTSGDLETLDLAFTQGVPVDVRDLYYKDPLMAACASGNYEVAQYLLSKGANVNMCDQFLWTPLHHAAQAGRVELVDLLLRAGANIEARTLGGGTPLMRAIQSCRPACVDFLIKAGANVKAENRRGQSCLDVASVFADLRIFDLVKDRLDSLPKPKEAKLGSRVTPRRSRADVKKISIGTLNTSTATTVKSISLKQSRSLILHTNTNITTRKTSHVDITFVPKTVWGKPPTTSQLLSKMERGKEPASLEVSFDDFMMPFSHQNTQAQPKTTD
ncbi:ankyrin repeat and EF-hand domain-containing protein 1a [Synchiropus splendidus]|uniref:ankyrin repeat and EF-hand domain-containing protein 1a n=1 Tax=Synchiropus splendidus TaxID=270530 RepID=UPI00237E4266|nr:ankyrin repeat and EF-hand domain-containing protein 1a [Synchiropus splendidus]